MTTANTDSDAAQRILATLHESITTNSPVTLTPDQSALLLAAFDHIAADQVIMTQLGRRLARYENAEAEVRTIIEGALSHFASVTARPVPDAAYDYVAAEKARAEIATAVAESRKEVLPVAYTVRLTVLRLVLIFARAFLLA